MIIKLFQPAFNNWLIIAEELDDPKVWDRFLPCHTVESERWKFDSTVKALANPSLKITVCRNYLRRGVSVFEYDFNSEENDVLEHAMCVAEAMGLELNFGPLSTSGKYAA